MTDLIPLDAAIAALEKWVQVSQSTWQSPMTVIRAIPTIDPAAIREAALREAETVVRQALVDAAYVYGSEPMKAKSAMFKAAVYATNAILALIGKANSMIGEKK